MTFLLGTADVNVTQVTSQVLSYFQNNIGTVTGLVLGIALFFWILRVVLSSLGIVGVHYDRDEGFSFWVEEEEERSSGHDFFWD